MRRSNRRPGLSLLELLVVLAILAVLFMLLLGGVQRVRSAAARTYCQNQMRQIAVAVHGYDGIHGHFPQGRASDTLPPEEKEPFPGLSWMGAILPQMGEDSLYGDATSAYATEKWPFAIPPHTPCSTIMKQYCCPGDNRVLQVQYVKGYTVALTSYLGVSGTDLRSRDGIFYPESRVGPGDITDAPGSILMIGERPPSTDLFWGWWYCGAGQWDLEVDSRWKHSGSLDVVLGAREINLRSPETTTGSDCPRGPYEYGPGKLDSPCDQFHFWSLHPGGCNFAFVDGSVRFVPYRAAAILPALATRNGGERVSFD